MTDTETKALTLLNECGWGGARLKRTWNPRYEALCRAIEQHEAYKQEVSDALSVYQKADGLAERSLTWDALTRFVIVKTDPLEEVLEMLGWTYNGMVRRTTALRNALAARGGRIVWGEG